MEEERRAESADPLYDYQLTTDCTYACPIDNEWSLGYSQIAGYSEL